MKTQITEKWPKKADLPVGCVETLKLSSLRKLHSSQLCTNLRAPVLHPIVSKCLQMFVHFIHNRLYHLHNASEYDEFVTLVHTARNAFCMTPGGIMQFNEVSEQTNAVFCVALHVGVYFSMGGRLR